MEPKKTLICAAIGLTTLLAGCGEEFPQYTASMKLTSITYSDDSFRGEQCWPKKLKVTQRMEHSGGMWHSDLLFEFQSNGKDCPQPTGSVVMPLERLTFKNEGAWPNDGPDGHLFYSGPEMHGVGAFCHGRVEYYMQLRATPATDTWKSVYPARGPSIGKDPVTGMELYESLSDPDDVELNENAVDKWNDELSDNGMTFELRLVRHINSVTDGCEDGLFPALGMGNAEAVAIYEAETIDQDTDIRKEPNNLQGSTLTKILFSKLVNGME